MKIIKIEKRDFEKYAACSTDDIINCKKGRESRISTTSNTIWYEFLGLCHL